MFRIYDGNARRSNTFVVCWNDLNFLEKVQVIGAWQKIQDTNVNEIVEGFKMHSRDVAILTTSEFFFVLVKQN